MYVCMHGSDSRTTEVDWPSLCLFKHVVIVVVHYDERASERINRGFCILFIYLFIRMPDPALEYLR